MGCLSIFIIAIVISSILEHWVLIIPFGLLIYFGHRKGQKKKQKEAEKRAKELKILIGKVKTEGLPIVETSLMLKSNERGYYQGEAVRLITTRRITRYEAGSRGMSVRVADGLTVRSGSSKGVPIREDVSDKFQGELVITNERIVFLSRKGFEFNIGQITALDHYSDAIVFQVKAARYVIKSPDISYIQIIVDEVIERYKLQTV